MSSLFFGFEKESSLMILFSGKTTWEISAKNPTLPGNKKKGRRVGIKSWDFQMLNGLVCLRFRRMSSLR